MFSMLFLQVSAETVQENALENIKIGYLSIILWLTKTVEKGLGMSSIKCHVYTYKHSLVQTQVTNSQQTLTLPMNKVNFYYRGTKAWFQRKPESEHKFCHLATNDLVW